MKIKELYRRACGNSINIACGHCVRHCSTVRNKNPPALAVGSVKLPHALQIAIHKRIRLADVKPSPISKEPDWR